MARDNDDKLKSRQRQFEEYEERREWIARGKYRFERDRSISLHRDSLNKIEFPFAAKESLFDESVYNEFKRLLIPPRHNASEGKPTI